MGLDDTTERKPDAKRTPFCSAALAVSGSPRRVKGVPYVDDDQDLKSLQSSKSRDLITDGDTSADLSAAIGNNSDAFRECGISLESKADGVNSFELMETDGVSPQFSTHGDTMLDVLVKNNSFQKLQQVYHDEHVIQTAELSSTSISTSSSEMVVNKTRGSMNNMTSKDLPKHALVGLTGETDNTIKSIPMCSNCVTVESSKNEKLKANVSTLLERRLWHQMNSLSQEPTNFKFTVGKWRKKPSEAVSIPKVLIELASSGGSGALRSPRHQDDIFDDKSSEDSCDGVTPEPIKPSHQRLTLIVGRMGSTSTTSTNVSFTPPVSAEVGSANVKTETSKNFTPSLRTSVLSLGSDRWYGRGRSELKVGTCGEDTVKRNDQTAQVRYRVVRYYLYFMN